MVNRTTLKAVNWERQQQFHLVELIRCFSMDYDQHDMNFLKYFHIPYQVDDKYTCIFQQSKYETGATSQLLNFHLFDNALTCFSFLLLLPTCVLTCRSYRAPRLQWHSKKLPSYSDTFLNAKSDFHTIKMFGYSEKCFGYSDTFSVSQHGHCKRGGL